MYAIINDNGFTHIRYVIRKKRKEEREREMNICNVKNRKIPMYMYIDLQEAILYYMCVKPYDVVESVCVCVHYHSRHQPNPQSSFSIILARVEDCGFGNREYSHDRFAL